MSIGIKVCVHMYMYRLCRKMNLAFMNEMRWFNNANIYKKEK